MFRTTPYLDWLFRSYTRAIVKARKSGLFGGGGRGLGAERGPDARSRIERRVLELSLDSAGQARLRSGYAKIRGGLRDLARQEGTAFIDCADAFDQERATTFTDLWHFADPGHAVLADRIVPGVLETLRRRAGAPPTRPGS